MEYFIIFPLWIIPAAIIVVGILVYGMWMTLWAEYGAIIAIVLKVIEGLLILFGVFWVWIGLDGMIHPVTGSKYDDPIEDKIMYFTVFVVGMGWCAIWIYAFWMISLIGSGYDAINYILLIVLMLMDGFFGAIALLYLLDNIYGLFFKKDKYWDGLDRFGSFFRAAGSGIGLYLTVKFMIWLLQFH